MNYLGHIFLSEKNERLMLGNFIGDFIKGKKYLLYPDDIQKGILLHRKIDSFTDSNIHWQLIREKIRPVYKKYSGVIADLFVDHFLASNWCMFSESRLDWHSKWTYAVLLKNFDILPPRVQQFIPYLIQHRRLQSYASIDGLKKSIAIMSNRTSLPDHTHEGIKLLSSEYNTFENLSLQFIHEISSNFIEC